MRGGSPWTIGLLSIAAALAVQGCGRVAAVGSIELRRAPLPSSGQRAVAIRGAPTTRAPIDDRDALPLPTPLARDAAERKAIELLEAASIERTYGLTEAQAGALSAAGFDEDLGLSLILGLLDGCLDEEGAICVANIAADDARRAAFYRLLPPLARLGSARTIALLTRLEERDFVLGDLAATMLETRASKSARAGCAAPTQAEVVKELSDLEDFVIIEADGGARSGRDPTPAELADLAYFLFGIRRDRARPGEPPVDIQGETIQPLVKEHEAARLAGDREAILRVGLAYFEALGHELSLSAHPTTELPDEASPIARGLGRELELRGRFAEAALAYRRGFAEPRVGCEPTGQIHERAMRIAIVRTEEAAGDCRGAVASRLHAPDEAPEDAHGPSRLARAGWDVARLYRGAALSTYRPELAAPPDANDFLSSDQAERTSARLDRWGDEAYDASLHALEGLAASADLRALPVLAVRIARGAIHERQRAMRVLTQLAVRLDTQLTPPQRAEMVTMLVQATKDRDWEIRVSAAQALGLVATRVPPALSALLRDPESPAGVGSASFPVREAARDAIKSIRAVLRTGKRPLASAARRRGRVGQSSWLVAPYSPCLRSSARRFWRARPASRAIEEKLALGSATSDAR